MCFVENTSKKEALAIVEKIRKDDAEVAAKKAEAERVISYQISMKEAQLATEKYKEEKDAKAKAAKEKLEADAASAKATAAAKKQQAKDAAIAEKQREELAALAKKQEAAV